MKGMIIMYNYNNGSSVPAKELSSKELKKAINIWSEGDKDLKNLLFTSYKLDLETSSCCAGSPYISYYLDDKKQINNIKKMLQLFRDEDDIQILITPDGGNPFSGKNWYRPFITFSKKFLTSRPFPKFSSRPGGHWPPPPAAVRRRAASSRSGPPPPAASGYRRTRAETR